MEHFYVLLQSTIQQSGEPLKVHEDAKKTLSAISKNEMTEI